MSNGEAHVVGLRHTGRAEAAAPNPADVAPIQVDRVETARDRLEELASVSRPGSGTGETWRRWSFLAEAAVVDVSLARLFEGHLDAVAIVDELGSPGAVPAGCFGGVWAARPGQMAAARCGSGWVLTGEKPWCSGSVDLDVALVTATAVDGPRLFAVDPSGPNIAVVEGTWTPLGMEGTRSVTLAFDGAVVDGRAALGDPGAYVDRAGFGHGGCGVAACWWGAALPVMTRLRTALAANTRSETLAHAVGNVGNAMHAAQLVLLDAADQIDRHPHDKVVSDHLALRVRSIVESAARAAVDAANSQLGTGPLSHDSDHVGRIADVITYLSQYDPQTTADVGRVDAMSESVWPMPVLRGRL